MKLCSPREITSLPLAAHGLTSYRCKSSFGWIMIGAKDDDEAMVQALRSSPLAKRSDLQKWDGNAYVPCPVTGERAVWSGLQSMQSTGRYVVVRHCVAGQIQYLGRVSTLQEFETYKTCTGFDPRDIAIQDLSRNV